MAELGRGVKAGIVAGIIYGIVVGILQAIVTIGMWDTIISAYDQAVSGYGVTMTLTQAVLLPTLFISGIIGGIIGGIILGLIYAAIYNSLPGSTSVKKGIVLAIIFWLIFSVGLGYASLGVYGTTFFIIQNIVIGLIVSIFWGYLLGKFWDRFAPAPAA
jgi:hypothetical protein